MPSISSVGPAEGVDVANVDFRVQNKSGADLERGDLAMIGAQQDALTGRFNSVETAGVTDVYAEIFCCVLQDIAVDGWGMVRVQGRVKHMKVGAVITVGQMLISSVSDKVALTTGLTKQKIIFKAESAGTVNSKVPGLFDGWAGFGSDWV